MGVTEVNFNLLQQFYFMVTILYDNLVFEVIFWVQSYHAMSVIKKEPPWFHNTTMTEITGYNNLW